MTYSGDERREHICITEDRLRVVLNEELGKHTEKLEKFCNTNIGHNLNTHKLEMGHVTKEEKGLIYDAEHYIQNNPKYRKSIIVKLGMPIGLFGLFLERLVSYLLHKG